MRLILRTFTRVGRRGYSLLFLGLLDEVYALAIPGAAADRPAAAHWLAVVLPLSAWAAIWGVVGAVLLISAFLKTDALAFALAALLKITWALVFLAGWLFNGVYGGWVDAAVWALFATWVLIISTWPEVGS